MRPPPVSLTQEDDVAGHRTNDRLRFRVLDVGLTGAFDDHSPRRPKVDDLGDAERAGITIAAWVARVSSRTARNPPAVRSASVRISANAPCSYGARVSGEAGRQVSKGDREVRFGVISDQERNAIEG